MEEREPFDLRTSVRDGKSGKIVKKQPYRLHVVAGKQFFERPVGSGNLWFLNGEPAGQVIDGKVKSGEPHHEWTAPGELEKQGIFAEKDKRIASLEAELRAIKQEKEKKAAESAEEKAKVAPSPAPAMKKVAKSEEKKDV